MIQHHKHTLKKPTYVAFVDYSTADPSIPHDGISTTQIKNIIKGHTPFDDTSFHYLQRK